MTTTRDLTALEEVMRASRGWKRKAFCDALGIAQSRLRRQIEAGEDAAVPRTLALAMSAVVRGLEPYRAGEGGGAASPSEPMGIRKSQGRRRAGPSAEAR